MATGPCNYCRINAQNRIAGWVLVAIFGLAAFGLDYACLANAGGMWGLAGIITISAVGGSMLVLNRSLKQYAWNDEIIVERRPWGSVSLLWDEIKSVDTPKGNVFVLSDVGGDVRMKIDFENISEDNGLREAIRQKLRALVLLIDYVVRDGGTYRLEPSGNHKIDDEVTLHEDGFEYSKKGASGWADYADVRFVYHDKTTYWHMGSVAKESLTLANETEDYCTIMSTCPAYPRALDFFREKLAGVQWVDMAASDPPQDPRAAYRYHVRRVYKFRKSLKGMWLWLPILAVVLGYLAIYKPSWAAAIGKHALKHIFELAPLLQGFYYMFQLEVSRGAMKRLEELANEGKVTLFRVER